MSVRGTPWPSVTLFLLPLCVYTQPIHPWDPKTCLPAAAHDCPSCSSVSITGKASSTQCSTPPTLTARAAQSPVSVSASIRHSWNTSSMNGFFSGKGCRSSPPLDPYQPKPRPFLEERRSELSLTPDVFREGATLALGP